MADDIYPDIGQVMYIIMAYLETIYIAIHCDVFAGPSLQLYISLFCYQQVGDGNDGCVP